MKQGGNSDFEFVKPTACAVLILVHNTTKKPDLQIYNSVLVSFENLWFLKGHTELKMW